MKRALLWLPLLAALLTLPAAAAEPVPEIEERVLADGELRELCWLTVDMSENSIILATPDNHADNDGGSGKGAPLLSMAESAGKAGHQVLAAVNGDFYKTPSDGDAAFANYALLGPMMKDGEWISNGQETEGSTYFGVDRDGKAVMGRADSQGDWHAVRANLRDAIGGELLLIHKGESRLAELRWRTDSATLSARYGSEGRALDEAGMPLPTLTSHPRTAVGILENGDVVFLCASLGYNTPGLTVVQLTELLLERGCVEAMNLDGGPSSQMAVLKDGELCHVREQGISRRIGGGLLVVAKEPADVQEQSTGITLLISIPVGIILGIILGRKIAVKKVKKRR